MFFQLVANAGNIAHLVLSGDWIAVWGVSDGPKGKALVKKVTSSKLRLKLSPDNETLNFYEINHYKEDMHNCSYFIINMTVTKEADNLKLEAHEGTSLYEGKLESFKDNTTMAFFQTCDHCLIMKYSSDDWGNYMLVYRDEDHYLNVSALKEEHATFHKHAACLGFPTEPAFIHDGTQDFCADRSDL
uniref:Uncharacterized protein n=1 Tax=Knipowitschia caucasica TaxID=637954 RepID=A0AAV2K8L2_KNICA